MAMKLMPRMPLHMKALILFVTFQSIMMLGTVGGLHVALPTITNEFESSITTTVWIMVAYSLALAGGTFALGKSTTLLERRNLITLGLVLDIVLLVATFYTTNIYLFIIFRFLSAFVRIYPWLILQVIGVGGFPPEHRGKVFGIMGIVQGFAMMASPPIAGFVTELWGWRWLFMGSAGAFTLMLIAVWIMIPRLDPPEPRSKLKLSQFDIPGSVLMMLGMVLLLASIQIYFRADASNMVIVFGIIAIIILALFFWVETHSSTPIVPFGLFRVKGIMMGSLQAVTMGWINGSIQLVVPFLLIVGFGWSVAYAASIMFFMGLVRPLARFVAGWASDKFGSSAVVVSAGVAAAIGQLAITSAGMSPGLTIIVMALILMGLSQASMQTANQRQIFNSMPAGQLHLAPSFSLVLTTSGSSIALAFVAAILTGTSSITTGSGIIDTTIVENSFLVIRVVTVIMAFGILASQLLPRMLGEKEKPDLPSVTGSPSTEN